MQVHTTSLTTTGATTTTLRKSTLMTISTTTSQPKKRTSGSNPLKSRLLWCLQRRSPPRYSRITTSTISSLPHWQLPVYNHSILARVVFHRASLKTHSRKKMNKLMMITITTTTKKMISMRMKKKTSRKQQRTSPNSSISSRLLTTRGRNSWTSSTETSRRGTLQN